MKEISDTVYVPSTTITDKGVQSHVDFGMIIDRKKVGKSYKYLVIYKGNEAQDWFSEDQFINPLNI